MITQRFTFFAFMLGFLIIKIPVVSQMIFPFLGFLVLWVCGKKFFAAYMGVSIATDYQFFGIYISLVQALFRGGVDQAASSLLPQSGPAPPLLTPQLEVAAIFDIAGLAFMAWYGYKMLRTLFTIRRRVFAIRHIRSNRIN